MTTISLFVVMVWVVFGVSIIGTYTFTTYAFKAYNVNLNKTIDLPIQPLYPKTTIQPGYPSCVTDAFTTIDNTMNKEKTQNPAMFKSDAFLAITLPNNNGSQGWSWCGLKH